MKSIYKYPLRDGGIIEGNFTREDILNIGYDAGGAPCLWAFVSMDDDAKTSRCRIFEIGTGWELNDLEDIFYTQFTKENYLGTLVDGPYIWHYFIDLIEED